MTDNDIQALWRKYVPTYGSPPNPKGEFVGTPYYAFARELEHRALAAGMMMRLRDGDPAPSSTRDSGGAAGALWAIVGWLIGK